MVYVEEIRFVERIGKELFGIKGVRKVDVK